MQYTNGNPYQQFCRTTTHNQQFCRTTTHIGQRRLDKKKKNGGFAQEGLRVASGTRKKREFLMATVTQDRKHRRLPMCYAYRCCWPHTMQLSLILFLAQNTLKSEQTPAEWILKKETSCRRIKATGGFSYGEALSQKAKKSAMRGKAKRQAENKTTDRTRGCHSEDQAA